jgi:diaminopimelate decarboxylase
MNKIPFERPIIKKINAGMPSKFGMKPSIMPLSHIDGKAVHELLESYGSPLHVLSENTIRQTYQEAKQAFETRYPKVQFAWSYKTNYLDAVCRIFHQEGAWAEVVSGMEYDKALQNGVPGAQIIFNGPGKSEPELMKAINLGSLIHIDHFDELFTIIKLSQSTQQKPKVAIRVNMDTGIYPKWDRFGFNYENGEAWEAINRIMLSKQLDLVGLHTHIGTYIMTADAYKIAATKLADLAVNLERKYMHHLRYLDLGGGFASHNTLKGAYHTGVDTTPSFETYAEAITSAIISSQLNPANLPLLILETGRALIDDAGYMLGTVVANKRLSDGRRSLIVDIGVNLLFTSFWYDHEMVPAKEVSQFTEETTICGPLCMNIDVLRNAIDFPVLKAGDQFVIKRTGAYNMTQWMQFINNRPAIVLLDKSGNDHLVRLSEKLETLTRQEQVPKHLQSA